MPSGVKARARNRAPSGPSVSPAGGIASWDEKAGDDGQPRCRVIGKAMASGSEIVRARVDEVAFEIGARTALADVLLNELAYLV